MTTSQQNEAITYNLRSLNMQKFGPVGSDISVVPYCAKNY